MAGEVSGNQQLPAEVLELVFRHLEHSDLATLLLVCRSLVLCSSLWQLEPCRFWAEVAGRPRLWSDLRLAVTPATLPVLPRLLGLRRLAALRALTVAWPPDSRARAAIAGHPAIVALTYRYCPLLLPHLLLSLLLLLLILHLHRPPIPQGPGPAQEGRPGPARRHLRPRHRQQGGGVEVQQGQCSLLFLHLFFRWRRCGCGPATSSAASSPPCSPPWWRGGRPSPPCCSTGAAPGLVVAGPWRAGDLAA